MSKNEVSEEVKASAKEAWDNHKDYYTISVSGNTYPIKDTLHSWAFFWKPETKEWISEYAGAWEKFLFERHIFDGDWPGVKMKCILNKKY